jgi:hypothetical protein
MPSQNFMDYWRSIPEVTKLQIIKDNPEQVQQMLTGSLGTAAGAANGGMQFPYEGAVNDIIQRYDPKYQPSHPNGFTPSDMALMSLGQNGVNPPGAQPGYGAQPQSQNVAPSPALGSPNNVQSPLTGSQQAIAQSAADKIVEQTRPAQQVNRLYYGTQVEQTLAAMEPFKNDASFYAGKPMSWGKEKLLSNFGGESDQYVRAQEFFNRIPSFASQIRSFYGDSIQPSVRKDLEDLVDPKWINTNPKLALQKFNDVTNTFQNEFKTTQSSASQVQDSGYQKKLVGQAKEGAINNYQQTTGKKMPGNAPKNKDQVLVVNAQGQQGYIPASQLNDALKQGYKKAQ